MCEYQDEFCSRFCSTKWFSESELIHHVTRGNHEEVRKLITELIAQGADLDYVNVRDFTGKTSLHLAVSENNVELTKILLDVGAKINVFNEDGHTPLHLCTSITKFDLMKLLISRGANVNAVDDDAEHYKSEVSYPLHMAVRDGNEEAIKYLIEKGARVDVFDLWNRTPLHIAASRDVTLTMLLIDRGANVNAFDPTPLDWMIRSRMKTRMKARMGVSDEEFNTDPSIRPCYPLHMAVRAGKDEVIECLIEKGAHVDVFDDWGHTPLHIAAALDLKLTKLLIDRGANVNAFDPLPLRDKIERMMNLTGQCHRKPGRNLCFVCYPLHMAVEAGKMDVVKLLIDRGADINALDIEGRSILYYAVKRNSIEMLSFFLKAGVSIDSDLALPAATSFKEVSNEWRLDIYKDLASLIRKADCSTSYEIEGPEDISLLEEMYSNDDTDDSGDVDTEVNAACVRVRPAKLTRNSSMVLANSAELQLVNGQPNIKPIILAVGERGEIQIVEMLLEAGADINTPGHTRETTVLHEAVKWGRRNIIELLLKRGANINALDENGKSLTSTAAYIELNPYIESGEYNRILELLLSSGASISNHKDNLRGAVLRGNVDTLRLLFRYGLKLKELNEWGSSEMPPLHLAACNKDVNVLKYLLKSSLFDIDDVDEREFTALHTAIENGYLKHTEVLLEYYADPYLRARTPKPTNTSLYTYGKSAIEFAVQMRFEKSVELLLFASSDLTGQAKKLYRSKTYAQRMSKLFRNTDNRSINQHLIKFSALLKVLGRQFNVSGKDFPKLSSSIPAPEFYKKCIAEIELMQESPLQNQITFYDIFTSVGFTQCLKWSRDLDVIDKKTLDDRFPIYGTQIHQRLSGISNARKLTSEAVRGLSIIWRKDIEPYTLIIETIFSQLNPRDLLALRNIADVDDTA
ncbi:hypothetical protein QAD02_005649 [Eretmocerus hayati]|uniref:Uncharacterized protein n=1 Tax=Eretmocerus hayati TaxID=131215 RepID=A0ACC2NTI4_9HYME|nr:hypothetical protein QAD02_005649 [Eretmocerus hayati]